MRKLTRRIAEKRHYKFSGYREGETLLPVKCVTPDDGYYVHTFFDICPFSPSGRYLLVTKLPYQGKKPEWGDTAEICLIDLVEETIEVLYATKVWAFQLGAQPEWGTTDRYVYANELIGDSVRAIRIDVESDEVLVYGSAKYHAAPSEEFVVGQELKHLNFSQYGYSLPDGPNGLVFRPTPEESLNCGIYKTSLETNETRLIASHEQIKQHLTDPSFFDNGVFLTFHVKVSPNSQKVLAYCRCHFPESENPGQRNPFVVVMSSDGNDIEEVIDTKTYSRKGEMGAMNHENWHPDGKHIVLNMTPFWDGDEKLRFGMVDMETREYNVLSWKALGSGHPSVEPSNTWLLSDCYPWQEYMLNENGEGPIRLLNLRNDEEYTLCTINSDVGWRDYMKRIGGSAFKLDPHPVWDRDYRRICFNGAPEGNRRVYTSDCSQLFA